MVYFSYKKVTPEKRLFLTIYNRHPQYGIIKWYKNGYSYLGGFVVLILSYTRLIWIFDEIMTRCKRKVKKEKTGAGR